MFGWLRKVQCAHVHIALPPAAPSAIGGSGAAPGPTNDSSRIEGTGAGTSMYEKSSNLTILMLLKTMYITTVYDYILDNFIDIINNKYCKISTCILIVKIHGPF